MVIMKRGENDISELNTSIKKTQRLHRRLIRIPAAEQREKIASPGTAPH